MQKTISRKESVDYYKTLAELALLGERSKLIALLDKRAMSAILAQIHRSLDVWNKAQAEFAKAEKITESPYILQEEAKPYAIDSIAASGAIGFQVDKLDFAFQAFTLYYLSVHLLDDLMEDPKKFYSKFAYSDKGGKERRIRASGTSFIFNTNIAIHNISQDQSGANPASLLRVENRMDESLAKMIKFLNIKNMVISPNRVLEVKNRSVSGEATAFFLEFARLERSHAGRINPALKDSITALGSLTQFTDDLRDLDEDRKSKNINLILSLRGLHGKAAAIEWARMYCKEEESMVEHLQKSRIDADTILLKTIPWYPFFAKSEVKKLVRH